MSLTPTIVPFLVAHMQSQNNQDYIASLISILNNILSHLRYRGAVAQAGYSSYFSVLSLLVNYSTHIDGNKDTKHAESHKWCQWLIQRGLYNSLQAHLLNLVSGHVQIALVDSRS